MSDLLAKMEAEQAAGWPRWTTPDPLLAEYVLTIRRAVNRARKTTSGGKSATLAGQTSVPAARLTLRDVTERSEAPDGH